MVKPSMLVDPAEEAPIWNLPFIVVVELRALKSELYPPSRRRAIPPEFTDSTSL